MSLSRSLGRSRFGFFEQLGRIRQILSANTFDGVADLDPAFLGARHGALHEHQTTLGIDTNDLKALDGDTLGTEVTGHLLAFENLPGS